MATIKLETFGPGTYGSTSSSLFQSKLLNAVNTAPANSVIDCTSYTGLLTLTNTVVIKKPLTLLFGQVTISFSTGLGKHMFHVTSGNVQIIGVSRSTATGSNDAGTIFKMPVSGAGYHVYAANTSSTGTTSPSGLVLENIDFEGLKSTYTSVNNAATYTYAGSGGIFIAEGNPEQSGTNVANVLLKNIHVNSAKHHGITLFGAITSRLEKCRVRNTGGHGYFITGSSTSIHLDTCYALSTNLAGFCLDGAVYSSMTTCAADNCSVGYWLKGSKGITLSSCGSENAVINSATLPYSLGITLWSSVGTVTINDIGTDNINFFKGTSFLITGGESNSLISSYSKDPGNRSGQITYANARTSHVTLAGSATLTRLTTPLFAGTSPVKYKIRIVPIGSTYPTKNMVDIGTYTISTASTEPADISAMLPLFDIFNQNNTQLNISFT